MNNKYTAIKQQYNSVMSNLNNIDILNLLKEMSLIIEENSVEMKSIFSLLNRETGNHSIKVANLSLLFGLALDLPNHEIQDLIKAALMHDIGKILIPDNIISKPGKLSDKEMNIIKKHPIIGYELVKNFDLSENAKLAIIDHHEKINGSGYPAGKKNDEISLYGKIVAICDVFEALSSKRCYKPAEESEVVMEFLISQRDIQFDTYLVNVFDNKIYPIISNIKQY